MAVTFDAKGTADATANAVTSITTSALTVGSGSNRALVVQADLSNKTLSSPAMNWDQLGTPTALTSIIGANGTGTVGRAELWGLVNPVSGAKQLKYSWTGSSDVYINGVSWTDVDQTGGATTFPHATSNSGTTTGNTVHNTVTVTSATNDAVMATGCGDAVTYSAVSGTQTFLDNVASTISGAGNRGAGAATVTLTQTGTGTSDHWVSVGTSIKAFVAPALVALPIHSSRPFPYTPGSSTLTGL